MKRIFSLLLAVLLVLTSLTVLSACARPTEIDFEGYTLIYSKDVSSDLAAKIKSFAATLSTTLGTRISTKAVAADAEEDNGDEYEILIGNTNRPESAAAKRKIKGHGYSISVEGEKLVIVGSTNLLTGMALDEFVRTYCASRAAESKLAVKKTVSEKMTVVTINNKWKLTYSARLDSSSSDAVKPDRQPAENQLGYDYPVVVANQIKDALAGYTDFKNFQFGSRDDATERGSDELGEILVGTTSREESISFINTLGNVDCYGVSVDTKTIVVAGVNDVGLRAASAHFKCVLQDSVWEDEEGTPTVVLPVGFTSIQTMQSAWVTDFPKPEGDGIILSGSTDVADNSVEYYYTGSGVTAKSYEDYCGQLEAAGYSRYMDHTAEGSIFRTYVHNTNKVTLQVTFAAYSHATEQGIDLYPPAIRIVSASLADVNLIDEDMLQLDAGYERVTDTRVTAVRLDYPNDSYGNCYIITLEDGSYVIYDGGFGGSNNNAILTDAITALHKDITGKEPSSTNPLRIKAWYLSHGHGDHYQNFYQFAKKNAGKVKFEYLITNFPSDTQTYNCYDPNVSLRNELNTFVKNFEGLKYIKVHSGQVFYLCNIKFEVLYTHEDIYPEIIHRYNDSSVALRTTVYHTDGNGTVTADSAAVTTLWLGDTQTGGSKCMRAMYGSYLKSDQVQIAHHGGNGCELELYQLVEPTCVWYPHSVDAYEGVIEKGPTAQKGTANYVSYNLCRKMSSVHYIIISDFYNTSMTFGVDGANYALYDADSNPSGLKHAGITPSRTVTYGKYVIKK